MTELKEKIEQNQHREPEWVTKILELHEKIKAEREEVLRDKKLSP